MQDVVPLVCGCGERETVGVHRVSRLSSRVDTGLAVRDQRPCSGRPRQSRRETCCASYREEALRPSLGAAAAPCACRDAYRPRVLDASLSARARRVCTRSRYTATGLTIRRSARSRAPPEPAASPPRPSPRRLITGMVPSLASDCAAAQIIHSLLFDALLLASTRAGGSLVPQPAADPSANAGTLCGHGGARRQPGMRRDAARAQGRGWSCPATNATNRRRSRRGRARRPPPPAATRRGRRVLPDRSRALGHWRALSALASACGRSDRRCCRRRAVMDRRV